MRTYRRRHRVRPTPAEAPPVTVDDLDGFATLDTAIGLEEWDGRAADEETVQEIAEQTPYGEVLLDDLIRRQLRLSVRVAAVFLVVLLVLPLTNLLAPRLMALHLLGLPVSWLALTVLVYPFLWILGAYFVGTAKKYEDDFTELVRTASPAYRARCCAPAGRWWRARAR